MARLLALCGVSLRGSRVFLILNLCHKKVNITKLDFSSAIILNSFQQNLTFCCFFRYYIRNRRSADDESNLDALAFIQYKSVQGSRKQATDESGKVYRDLENRYRLNVTHTYVVINHLESGMKYKVVLKAVNRNTDSLTVTKQTFTGNLS